MVYIKKIMVQSFKSFGSKRSMVELPKGLVVITGPNGGGKSNILDAIKFALGELSPHSLRVGRLSELVHEDSHGKAPFAKVSITIDNSERIIPIDSDEVTISRKINQNGESEYFVNGRNVSRAELLTLLAAANIRPSGFNIVPQGSVLNLAEMSPAEMRKLIEDVAGIAEYDRRKAEAEEQLRQAERNLEVAKASTYEVKNRVRQLEKERNQFLRRLSIENEIKKIKLLQLKQEEGSKLRELESIELKIKDLEAKLKDKESIKKDLESAINNMNEKLLALEREISSMELDYSELSKKRNSIYDRLLQLKLDLKERIGRKEALTRELELSTKRLSELERDLLDCSNNVKELDEKISISIQEKRAIEDELSRVSNEIRRLQDIASEIEHKLREASRSWDEKERKHKELLERLEKLRLERERIEIERSKLVEEITFTKERFEDLSKRYDELVLDIDGAKDKVRALRERLKVLSEEERRYSEFVNMARGTIDEVTRFIEEAEMYVTVKDSRDQNSNTYPSEFLERLKSIKGVVGIVKDTFANALNGNISIMDVLKGWEDAIVVKNHKIASALIETSSQLGFDCKFVILDGEDIDSWMKNNIVFINNYEDYGKINSKGKIAIMPNGVVCYPNNLVFVVKGSKERSIDLIKSDIRKLREIVKDVDKRCQSIEVERLKIMNEVESIKRMLEDLNSLQIQKEIELKTISVERKILEENLQKLNDRMKVVEDWWRKIFEEEKDIKNRLDALSKDEGIPCEDHKELKNRLLSIRSELKELESTFTELKVKLGEKIASIKFMEDLRARSLLNIEKLKIDIENARNLIASIEEKIEIEKDEISKVMDEISRFESEVSKMDIEIDRILSRLREVAAERDKIKLELSQKLEDLRKLSDEIKRVMDEIQSYNYHRLEINYQLQSLNERISSLKDVDVTGMAEFPPTLIDQLITSLEDEMNEISIVNQLAPNQYVEIIGNYKLRSMRISELEAERREIVNFINAIESEKLKSFFNTMERISEKFAMYFNRLTKGVAWLRLEDESNPSTSGVEVAVQFVGKPVRSLRSVSGGEKSIAAVSLLLALQGLTPADFYVFDEVDAHMDVVYTTALADLLKEMSRNTQIIIISLKDVLAEKADQLIGVYMSKGESRILKLKLEDIKVG